jgi:hypothetical protein
MTTEEPTPPRELLVDAKPAPGDASTGSGTAMAPFVLTVGIAGLLAKLVSPTMGLIALVACIAVLVVLRKPNEGRFVLRIEEASPRVLVVTRERARTPPLHVPLADVLNVTLDRQTSSAGGRGGSMERVRLGFERRAPDEPIFIPEERITPIEAQEWQGKVRVFLRKHGWMPESERT